MGRPWKVPGLKKTLMEDLFNIFCLKITQRYLLPREILRRDSLFRRAWKIFSLYKTVEDIAKFRSTEPMLRLSLHRGTLRFFALNRAF